MWGKYSTAFDKNSQNDHGFRVAEIATLCSPGFSWYFDNCVDALNVCVEKEIVNCSSSRAGMINNIYESCPRKRPPGAAARIGERTLYQPENHMYVRHEKAISCQQEHTRRYSIELS